MPGYPGPTAVSDQEEAPIRSIINRTHFLLNELEVAVDELERRTAYAAKPTPATKCEQAGAQPPPTGSELLLTLKAYHERIERAVARIRTATELLEI